MNQLTLFVADTPARESPPPAYGAEPKTRDGFGLGSQRDLGFYDPDTHSLRTWQRTLEEPSGESLVTLPPSGSMSNGRLFQRQPLVPRTSATGSSSWPTPCTSDYKGATSVDACQDWAERGTNLPEAVQLASVGRWPTPTARLGDRYFDPARSNDLDDAVAASGTPGQLNPTWVEWLMGFPTGWTALDASETPSSPRSPSG